MGHRASFLELLGVLEHDPAQSFLFQVTTLDAPSADATGEPSSKEEQKRKRRTSQGRRSRVFPEYLPREEQEHYSNPEDILGRSGFRIDRSTQWRWMRGHAEGVTPLVDRMWTRCLLSDVLGICRIRADRRALARRIQGELLGARAPQVRSLPSSGLDYIEQTGDGSLDAWH